MMVKCNHDTPKAGQKMTRKKTLKEIREDITDIKITVKAIETTLAEQPKHYDGRFKEHDRRISGLENNQRWLVLAVIGSLLTAVMKIILK